MKSPIVFPYSRKARLKTGSGTIVALLFWILASTTLVNAVSPAEKRLSMEQRLTEADIDVALRHYERVCSELLETRLRKTLAETEPTGPPAEKEKQLRLIAQKIELLEQYAKNLREELLKAGRIDVTSGR